MAYSVVGLVGSVISNVSEQNLYHPYQGNQSMEPSPNTGGVLFIGLLAVIGISLTAATMSATYSPDLHGAGEGTDVEGNLRQGDEMNGTGDNRRAGEMDGGTRSGVEIPQICIRILTQPFFIFALVLTIVAAVGIVYERVGFIGAMFTGYLLGLPSIVTYGILTRCGPPGGTGASRSMASELLRTMASGGGLTGFSIPPVVLGAVFVIASVVAIGALVSASGSEQIEQPEEEAVDEGLDLEQFAAAAGDAADRIESTNVAVDNAVYRAWSEMTELLDSSNPESSTPGDFAAAAMDAGMADDDVKKLTTLFEEVRYGDMDPGPREDLAIETLRDIQDTYTSVESTPDGTGGDTA